MTPATFYIVNGPRGVYYAVRNHHTGKVWTERTELAAEQQCCRMKAWRLSRSEDIDPAPPVIGPDGGAGPVHSNA